ncbi:TPA: mevalonate kinase [archaeon]|nr:mevalonate kinase [Candidatus Naiadarchaeales archaeon SRR2090159.bin1288]
MIKASAPGKLILFGEHIVVYGEPAIATAIDKRAYATATELEGRKIVVISNGETIEADLTGKTESPVVKAAQVALQKTNATKGVQIEINSEIPVAAGLGSSASVSVATAAAVLKLFSPENEPSKFEILEIAHEAEKIAHGNPSGIDTAVSVFGGTIFYRKGDAEGLGSSEMQIVVGNTGVPRNTKAVVENVKSRVEDPRVSYNLFTISSIVKKARDALLKGSISDIGFLMDRNQEYLRALGVSSLEIESMIKIAKDRGAAGAKLTGAGGGGCIIALSNKPEVVKKAFSDAGFDAFIVRTNQEGVRYEQ